MKSKITIDVNPQHEGIVRRLALAEEMEQLALTAPQGHVFDTGEEAVVEKRRKLQSQLLGAAVTRRIEAAERGQGQHPERRLERSENRGHRQA